MPCVQLALEMFDVLGMNGQDSTTGRYSVVAPRALVLHEGRPSGRANVLLTGSFFDQIRDDRTKLVEYPWSLNPGLLIWADIQPRP